MQAVGSRSAVIPDFSSSSNSSKGCRLSFYKTLPDKDVALDDFEEYAIARLQVLRRIDVLRAQGAKGEKFTSGIVTADQKHLFPTTIHSNNQAKDLISHFVLRMAYCKTEELRKWFLANELQLFTIRLGNAKPADVDAFLEQNNLKYPPISKSEKVRLRSQLLATDEIAIGQYESMEFYKVPFMDVPKLVAQRRVFLERGYAYVSRENVSCIVEEQFRSSLSKSLTLAYKASLSMSRDERIDPLVRNLAKIAFRYGGTIATGTAVDGNINSESVVNLFTNHLTTVLGHTTPKMKPAGGNRMYVNVGTSRPNEADRTCPIVGRIHKSNTQKYQIYFDTQVMMQGCWDGCCQATNKHVFYQIQEGKVVKVGWVPPPVLALQPNNAPSKDSRVSQ